MGLLSVQRSCEHQWDNVGEAGLKRKLSEWKGWDSRAAHRESLIKPGAPPTTNTVKTDIPPVTQRPLKETRETPMTHTVQTSVTTSKHRQTCTQSHGCPTTVGLTWKGLPQDPVHTPRNIPEIQRPRDPHDPVHTQ